MRSENSSRRVAVIGAGIVGICCAIELLRDGHEVTLIEPGESGGTQSASYGNGAWISPASVVPMSMPGLWKKVPGYLLDPDGPLTIRWRALPALLPWLLHFLRAGATVARVQATAHALSALLHDAPQRHARLAREAGVPELIVQRGLLYAYPDRAAFEADALAWQLRRETGVQWQEWDADTMAARVPPLSRRYRLGAWVHEGAHCLDPGRYVAALARHALGRGARWHQAQARGFALDANRLAAVQTDAGDVPCDCAVIAAGIGSRALARAAGERIPMQSERGYHIVLTDPPFELPLPVMPSDGKMGHASLSSGLRLSGQVELATVQAPPNWRRADILLKHARASYDALDALAPETLKKRAQLWMGHRPSTPDGRPVLGRGREDIFHAFGHGHVGLASGPISGRLIADLVSGRAPLLDPAPYSPRRFARA